MFSSIQQAECFRIVFFSFSCHVKFYKCTWRLLSTSLHHCKGFWLPQSVPLGRTLSKSRLLILVLKHICSALIISQWIIDVTF